MKFSVVFKVLCVLLTLEASRAAADSSVKTLNYVDPVIPIKEGTILDVAQTKDEPIAGKKHEAEDPFVAEESKVAAVVVQQKNVNETSQVGGDVEAPMDVAMIQKQIELLKQPGMRRLARQLNRFHQGQLFGTMQVAPPRSEDDVDDAIAEERAVRRRTRIRRRNSNNKIKANRHNKKVKNSNKLTRRKQNNRNSFKRKNAKGGKNQKNRRGLRNGNKKGAKGVKKTKRNRRGQNNSKRRLSTGRKYNRRNNKRQSFAQDEDIDDTSFAE